MKKLSKIIGVMICFLFLAISSVSAVHVPEAYHPIIQRYIDNYKSGNLNQGELGYSTEDVTPQDLYEKNAFGFEDWNGDGSPELLIGDDYDGSGKLCDIYAIYTLVNGAPQLVAKSADPGETFGLKPAEDCANDPSVAGCIVKDKFFKELHRTTAEFYRLDGANLNFVKSYTFNDDEVYSNPKYYSSIDINNPLETEIGDPGDLLKAVLDTNIPATRLKKYDISTNPTEGPAGTIYRLNHPDTNEHLYTSQFNEASELTRNGWEYEGHAWQAPENGMAVYRLYNPQLNDHLYTMDENEVRILAGRGWQVDNNDAPLFYSGGEKIVYRLYNPSNAHHLLTTDENEYIVLGNNGWNQEGIALYGV